MEVEDILVRTSKDTHARLERLQEYAKTQGIDITVKNIVKMAVNELPLKFFKRIKKDKK